MKNLYLEPENKGLFDDGKGYWVEGWELCKYGHGHITLVQRKLWSWKVQFFEEEERMGPCLIEKSETLKPSFHLSKRDTISV